MKKESYLLVLCVLVTLLLKAQTPTFNEVSNLLPVIHWQSQSPVKNQGVKYTCTAFAIAAALETFPKVPKDLSEKYLYGFQKGYQYGKTAITQGHNLFSYIESLKTDGVIEEKYLPYKLDYDKVRPMTEDQFINYMYEGEVGLLTLGVKYKKKATVFVTDLEYLNAQKAKNINYIKEQLRRGVKAVPVSYPILYVPAWKGYPSKEFHTITPDDGFKVNIGNGVYQKYSIAKSMFPNINQQILNSTKPIEPIYPYPGNQYAGHAVTIIGYDQEGFIIKNSYGPQWGVGGYERVSYDFHEIFATEALIIRSVKVKKGLFGW